MPESLFDTAEGLRRLESDILPGWLEQQRWYSGKSRNLTSLKIVKSLKLESAWLFGVEAKYAEGPAEVYSIPLATVNRESHQGEGVIDRLGDAVLCDAVFVPQFRSELLSFLQQNNRRDSFVANGESWLDSLVPDSRVLGCDQSNTSIIFDERAFLKLYRKLNVGLNPDIEISRAISGHSFSARFGGDMMWGDISFALVTAVIPHRGDAWALAMESFLSGAWFCRLEHLGVRTGEMHIALAESGDCVGFEPEKAQSDDVAKAAEKLNDLHTKVIGLLDEKIGDLSKELRLLVEQVKSIDTGDLPKPHFGKLIRTHGDFHLGQVLDTGSDFVFIDFEGEPSRSLDDRRVKHPAIRDVAGMLRSIHYAAHAARKLRPDAMLKETESWAAESQQHFLDGWRKTVRGSFIESKCEAEMLRFFLMEKAIYEIDYELNNRPDWLEIPVRGLLSIYES